MHTNLPKEFEVGTITRKRNNKIVGSGLFAFGSLDNDFVFFNYCNIRIEICINTSFFNAIFNVGAYPVFYTFANLFTANYHGYVASLAAYFQSRIYRRITGAYNNYFLHNERMRLFVDRKSTRLNSSHVRISYAVFCLKKKK